MNLKIIIGIVVLLPVLAHFGYSVAVSPTANYYVSVDEYVGQPASSGAARVGGTVVPGSINWDNGSKTLRFQIAGDSSILNVTYKGPVPDSFRDGVTAVLEGAKGANGVLAASNIMVKCPHQYLPAGRVWN